MICSLRSRLSAACGKRRRLEDESPSMGCASATSGTPDAARLAVPPRRLDFVNLPTPRNPGEILALTCALLNAPMPDLEEVSDDLYALAHRLPDDAVETAQCEAMAGMCMRVIGFRRDAHVGHRPVRMHDIQELLVTVPSSNDLGIDA